MKYVIIIALLLLVVGCTQAELAEEPIVEEPTEDLPVNDEVIEEAVEEPIEEPVVEEPVSEEIEVMITSKGFDPDEMTIATGDTVTWKFPEDRNFKKAIIVGSVGCREIKSEMFEDSETFSYTFEEPVRCTIVDAVTTSFVMKIIVE